MELNFKPIKTGDTGKEVANTIAYNFDLVKSSLSELSKQTDSLKVSPLLYMSPTILYTLVSEEEQRLTATLSVYYNGTHLNYENDYTLAYDLDSNVYEATSRATNDGDMEILVIIDSGNTKEDIITAAIDYKGDEYSIEVQVIVAESTTTSEGRGVFVSTVFIRSEEQPTTPSGGTYNKPIPSSGQWSDGIPTGSGPLWASHRKFTTDGVNQDASWSEPVKAFDNGDIDVAYSNYSGTPEPPGSIHPTQGEGSAPYYWHDNGKTDDIWMAMSSKVGGVWGSWSIMKIKGEAGRGTITSYIFTRSDNGNVTAPDNNVGTFTEPSPAEGKTFTGSDGVTQWHDAIPTGTSAIYMSSRIFTSDGKSPAQSSWQTPKLMVDSDTFDVCYHKENDNGTQPANPTKHGDQGSDENTWHNTGHADDYWMAMSVKQNGIWGEWQVMKIKGEKGQACATSYVFAKSYNTISDPPLPTSGYYKKMNPDQGTYWLGESGTKWYDSPGDVQESGALYMSSRVFTSDGEEPQDAQWSTPTLLADSDTMDVCYHKNTDSGAQPAKPTGDHGAQGDDTEKWHDTANENDYWMAMALRHNGEWEDWTIMKIKNEAGQASFTSYVFTRSNNVVIDAPSDDKGSYFNPNPDSNGWAGSLGTMWYDGIGDIPKNLTGSTYMSSRVFTNDGASPQQSSWQKPVLLVDSDTMDICFCPLLSSGNQPDEPTNHGSQGTNTTTWHDTANENDYWMAVSYKKAGEWGPWSIMKIKGEQGEPGTSGLVMYFDPTNIAMTQTGATGDTSYGIDTGSTYARLYAYDNNVDIDINNLKAEIISEESVNLDTITYGLSARLNSNIQIIPGTDAGNWYSGKEFSWYFWITGFKPSATANPFGTAKFKITYNGETYYKTCSWTISWLGTFKESIENDIHTTISDKVKAEVSGMNLVTVDSAQTMIQQSASGITERLGSVERQYNALSGQVASQNTNIASIQKTSSGLSVDMESISQRQNGVESGLITVKQDVSSIQATASSLETEYKNLAGDVSTVQQTANSLKGQIEDVSGNVATVSASTSAITLQLNETGIDIQNHKITLSGNTEFKDSEGKTTALFENGKIKADYIDASQIKVDNISVVDGTKTQIILNNASAITQSTKEATILIDGDTGILTARGLVAYEADLQADTIGYALTVNTIGFGNDKILENPDANFDGGSGIWYRPFIPIGGSANQPMASAFLDCSSSLYVLKTPYIDLISSDYVNDIEKNITLWVPTVEPAAYISHASQYALCYILPHPSTVGKRMIELRFPASTQILGRSLYHDGLPDNFLCVLRFYCASEKNCKIGKRSTGSTGNFNSEITMGNRSENGFYKGAFAPGGIEPIKAFLDVAYHNVNWIGFSDDSSTSSSNTNYELSENKSVYFDVNLGEFIFESDAFQPDANSETLWSILNPWYIKLLSNGKDTWYLIEAGMNRISNL